MLTWIEVSQKAIKHNLQQFRKLIGPDCLLMPVIKANAYGHGFFDVAKICDKATEVDKICVVNDDEAVSLVELGIKKPIVILTFYETDNPKKGLILAKKGVIFPLFTLKQAIFLNKIGERASKKIKVHIKVDTGASRVGLLPEEFIPFLKKIKKFSNLKIDGLFSHFAASEEDRVFTEYQMKRFETMVGEAEQQGFKFPLKHFACSAASVLYAKSHLNAIRLGLSLYGLYPDELSKKKIKLQPALSWHTKIIQVRTVPAWSKIGYGGSYTTKKTTKLATLPIGYWDGYDRNLSNNAFVLINGIRCPIRGRICMNICMADVSAVKNVKVGDKATLIGRQGKKEITADELAKWAGTINYEIVDRINPLLIRKPINK
ncbi:MAG: alanine racemase [Candidatus Magasanikbacteria bacterium CG10_big_fil_rev_8_21_14_0_10_36_32]|uniref:Alanine racemase n=1 Tax=Candidatus Magasanikbacteria bacterium CG10_big_fil_rev_8_21_14_0_10_36_32 TaxID=1974646 RepID=A0A2M6W7P0_9BACT|nr:MAG: alanine racemase [Candidatus Magasanikbacteria bacterium CG10_big_fil_rev_8_21_14_0_10_36_32]